jgi:hypothetical protein
MCIIKKETQNRDYYICIVSVFDASADQNLKVVSHITGFIRTGQQYLLIAGLKQITLDHLFGAFPSFRPVLESLVAAPSFKYARPTVCVATKDSRPDQIQELFGSASNPTVYNGPNLDPWLKFL